MSESRFLKLSAGFLNPAAIRWAEEHGDALAVSVAGKDNPILLKGGDARQVRLCLLQRLVSLPDLADQDQEGA